MKTNTPSNPLKHLKTRMPLNIIMLLVLLVAGALFVTAVSRNQEVRQRASGGTNMVDIFMNPDTARIQYHSYQSFVLTMNTHAFNVGRADLWLKFDKDKIDDITYVKGSALTFSTAPTPTIVVNYAAGTAHITLHTNTARGEQGSSLNIGTLRVRQKNVGISSIAFSKTGTTISKIFAKNGTLNIAGTLNGASITGTATTANVDLGWNPYIDTLPRGTQRTYPLIITTNGGAVSRAAIVLTYDPTAITINSFATTSASVLPWVAARFAKPSATKATITLEKKVGGNYGVYSGQGGVLGNLTLTQTGTKSSFVYLTGTAISQVGNPGNAAGTLGTLNLRYPTTPTPTPTGGPSAPSVTWRACTGNTRVATLAWTGTPASGGFTVNLKRGTNLYKKIVSRTTHSVASTALRLNGTEALLKLTAGQTFVANVKGAVQGPNTSTITVPACPTPTPPTGKTTEFRVKLAQVSDDSADGAKIAVSFLPGGNAASQTQPQTIELSHVANGVYKGIVTIPSTITTGTKFTVLVRGEKHLGVVFTHISGQTTRCNDGLTITMPSTVPTTFDFTSVPLPAGDTIPQNGVVDTGDISAVSARLNKASTEITADDLKVADLNYDEKVTFVDQNMIYTTTTIACTQY